MLSALDLARELEAGTLTPDALFDRIETTIAEREDTIRAFTCLDLAAARAAARTATGPLRALPLAVKDNIDTGDLVTEYGSPIHAGHRPAVDAAIVALARRLGAVIPGKTVTTEFAFFHPGPTRNPHDPKHTPGGSSSGSAAGVAASFFPLALGTQTGGSVVRPAAFCGVAGFKPSYGRLPVVGVKIFSWSLDTLGLFAASVQDAAFAAGVLAGRDWRIDGELSAAPTLGILRQQPGAHADEQMQAALETAIRSAEACGARLVELTLPEVFADAFKAHKTIQDYEAARALAAERDLAADRLSDHLRQTLDEGWTLTAADYDAAQTTAADARRACQDLFSGIDALLLPSAPGAAPRGLGSTGSSEFNRIWTLMGVPAVNVPGLYNGAGLPLGVQVLGPRNGDKAALAAAAWLEACLGSGRI